MRSRRNGKLLMVWLINTFRSTACERWQSVAVLSLFSHYAPTVMLCHALRHRLASKQYSSGTHSKSISFCRQITNNDYNKDVYCFSNNHCHSCHSPIPLRNKCQLHIRAFGVVCPNIMLLSNEQLSHNKLILIFLYKSISRL